MNEKNMKNNMVSDKEDMKDKIIKSAWNLFNSKGYKNTTVNDIIAAAGTSKGGFYYYFRAKDELLNSLYSVFDEAYKKYYEKLDANMNNYEKIIAINDCVFHFIEEKVDCEILSVLYQSQLVNHRKTGFLDSSRYYFKMLSKIITLGQEKKEIRTDLNVDEIIERILLLQKGEMFNWCINDGNYSIGYLGTKNFNMFFKYFKYE